MDKVLFDDRIDICRYLM